MSEPIPPPITEKKEDVSSSPTPRPLPSPKTLQSWLPLYLHKSDTALETLSRILATPSGTDTLLMTICYTSLLTSSLLSSFSLHTIRAQIRRILKGAAELPPNTTVLVDLTTIPSSPLLVTAVRLKALSSLISDVRIFARIFGLVGIYKWGKSVAQAKDQDVVIRRITGVQVACNVIFQALENGAYLSSKGVLGWSPEKQNKAWLWSCRFWMAHVVLDFGRLWRQRQLAIGQGKEEGGEWERSWWREVVVNGSWFPLTAHWSLEGGLLSDFGVGAFGSVCGLSGLQVLLKNVG